MPVGLTCQIPLDKLLSTHAQRGPSSWPSTERACCAAAMRWQSNLCGFCALCSPCVHIVAPCSGSVLPALCNLNLDQAVIEECVSSSDIGTLRPTSWLQNVDETLDSGDWHLACRFRDCLDCVPIDTSRCRFPAADRCA